MTQPQREIVGKFTENFEYTVNGEPLSHPVWAPRKPNERWTITPNEDFTAATAKHPEYPTVVFAWDQHTDVMKACIEWQAGPVYVTSENHICALPELFMDFMYSMMKLAERPIHQFPNNAIKFY